MQFCRDRIHGWILLVLVCVAVSAFPAKTGLAEDLVFHKIRTDEQGYLVPWYSREPGIAYDYVVREIWNFWKNMKDCPNGVKYYMQHQVWSNPVEDARGLGGDQLAMALSSWNLLHAYTGDRSIVDNMRYIADYYLAHGLSRGDCAWPHLLYPYNTEPHSGIYDGDMSAGKGYLQPDKSGSFASELVTLYEITGKTDYLNAAVRMADVLAAKVTPGDDDHSPWPYRVHAVSGQVSIPYTANWTGTMRLFEELTRLHQGNTAAYRKAHQLVSVWLQQHPMKTNKWGPFFEDVSAWSDTEINADTMAWYILEHPQWTSTWREAAKTILEWSRSTFANNTWAKYGVTAINEQTVYLVPGNSHTSRHASVQLVYSEKTGDTTRKADAVRQLNWATYMVGDHGNNTYPLDNVWLTDGFGDYVRHYLRAMAAAPELAPSGQSHLLKTSSVIKTISYAPDKISYSTFDTSARDLLRVAFRPAWITASGKPLPQLSCVSDLDLQPGYTFEAVGDGPGVLRIRHDDSGDVTISGGSMPSAPAALSQAVSLNQATSASFVLTSSVEKPAQGETWKYSLYGPFHGKLSGTAPHLTYTPDPNFLGTDTLTFRILQGEQESQPALITFRVARLNLARLPGAFPFTTENPQTGATGVFPLPALTDNDLTLSASAGAVLSEIREAAIGINWPAEQVVRQVVFQQGLVGQDGNGFFNRNFRLQFSSDGVRWQDAADCTVIPIPYAHSPNTSMKDFTITLAQPLTVRGIRIMGSVGGSGPDSSKFLKVRELQAFASLASPEPPKLEYETENQIVAEGDTTTFGVRMVGTSHMAFQWQRSIDQGKTWKDIDGANSAYLAVRAVSMAEYNGNLFRCVVSNGTPPNTVSKPMTLTVRPKGSGVFQAGRIPLH